MGSNGGGGSGGGGGSSGDVRWPGYFEDVHEDLLQNAGQSHALDAGISMVEAIEDSWGNSPYEDSGVYDPSGLLAETEDRYETFDNLITFDPETKFEEFWDTAKAKIDADIGDPTRITDAVEAFEQNQINPLQRRIARFAAGARDVNAVMSSAFLLGIAFLEQEAADNVDQFSATLQLQNYNDKIKFYDQATKDIMSLFNVRLQAEENSVRMRTEINRISIVAFKEQVEGDLEIAVKDANWNIELFQPAANLLAAGHGGTANPTNSQKQRHGVSSVGGAFSGGAAGLATGAGLVSALSIGAGPFTGGASTLLPLIMGGLGAGAGFLGG